MSVSCDPPATVGTVGTGAVTRPALLPVMIVAIICHYYSRNLLLLFAWQRLLYGHTDTDTGTGTDTGTDTDTDTGTDTGTAPLSPLLLICLSLTEHCEAHQSGL